MTSSRIRAAKMRYCRCACLRISFAKRYVIALLGSCLFITVAVCFQHFVPRATPEEQATPGFHNYRANVQCWMWWAAGLWHFIFIISMVIELIPLLISWWSKTFTGLRYERVKTRMEFYNGLSWNLGLVLISALNWGCWAFLIDYPYSSVKNQLYTGVIWKIFAAIFISSVLLFVEKVFILIITNNFKRIAYKDRLEKNHLVLKILDNLSRAEHPAGSNRSHRPSGLFFLRNANRSSNDVRAGKRSRYASGSSDIFELLQKRLLRDKEVTMETLDDKNDINSVEMGRKVAKRLFYSLAAVADQDKDEELEPTFLKVEHFEPHFITTKDAEEAFSVFDKDESGRISRREFRDTVVEAYRERKILAMSMRDTTQVVGKVHGVFKTIALGLSAFITLALFHANAYQALVPFATFLIGLSFIFKDSCAEMFSNTVYVLGTHPFDVGDVVLIDKAFYIVKSIDLMGTLLVRGSDNAQVYVSNSILRSKEVANCRRAGDMCEVIKFNIDFSTATEKFHMLREKIIERVAEMKDDFVEVELRASEVIDLNQLFLVASLCHKGNWQN
ncbi:hypothetical protein BJV82DRAFT_57389 [Fennellomyces sp. T-0311]|nr:hypothetical protein BJV82DRAFT_57389 [Fennellomyces sp. T-0311]